MTTFAIESPQISTSCSKKFSNASRRPRKSPNPCWYFLSTLGSCPNGENCVYQHGPPLPPLSIRPSKNKSKTQAQTSSKQPNLSVPDESNCIAINEALPSPPISSPTPAGSMTPRQETSLPQDPPPQELQVSTKPLSSKWLLPPPPPRSSTTTKLQWSEITDDNLEEIDFEDDLESMADGAKTPSMRREIIIEDISSVSTLPSQHHSTMPSSSGTAPQSPVLGFPVYQPVVPFYLPSPLFQVPLSPGVLYDPNQQHEDQIPDYDDGHSPYVYVDAERTAIEEYDAHKVGVLSGGVLLGFPNEDEIGRLQLVENNSFDVDCEVLVLDEKKKDKGRSKRKDKGKGKEEKGRARSRTPARGDRTSSGRSKDSISHPLPQAAPRARRDPSYQEQTSETRSTVADDADTFPATTSLSKNDGSDEMEWEAEDSPSISRPRRNSITAKPNDVLERETPLGAHQLTRRRSSEKF